MHLALRMKDMQNFQVQCALVQPTYMLKISFNYASVIWSRWEFISNFVKLILQVL